MNGRTGPPPTRRSAGITRRGMIGGMVVSMVVPAIAADALRLPRVSVPRPAAGPPSTPLPRSGHTATALPNGQVLVAGGFHLAALNSAQLFDPSTGAWTAAASMRMARTQHAAACLPDGRILVCGGVTGAGQVLASAEVYDPATDTWAAAPSMNSGRAGHSAVATATGVLVVGGYNLATLSSAEAFDGFVWSVR